MNAGLPQASYPCGNFSDTSNRTRLRPKWSIGKWPEYFSYDLFMYNRWNTNNWNTWRWLLMCLVTTVCYTSLHHNDTGCQLTIWTHCSLVRHHVHGKTKTLMTLLRLATQNSVKKTMLGWLLLRRKQTRLVHLYENISKYGIYLFVSTNCFIIVIRVCFQLWILFFLSTKVHKSIETAVVCFV